ncbi:MAG: PAS domain-containing sensor histidine kinase [Bacteroidia bacterium]
MIRSFRFNVILRILALLASMVGLVYAWEQKAIALGFITFGVLILLTWSLIRYVELGSRDLSRFLESIKHRDHTQRFTPDGKGYFFDAQRKAQNDIMGEFQRLRAEKEAHHVYLQTVIKHVQVALLCVGKEGEIILMNPAASELLGKPYLHNLAALGPQLAPLSEQLDQLKTGERTLLKVALKGEIAQLALACTDFKLQDEPYRLISLQNIQAELEAQEFDAWQKLIRVLTHEIMNSVTPIISLATASQEMVRDGIDEDEQQDLEQSLEVIARRSKGMQHFVQSYRNLTRIPQPVFQQAKPADICQRVALLMEPELQSRGIALTVETDDTITLNLDPQLIEQVVINLVKNAMEALAQQPSPTLNLSCKLAENGDAQIIVSDNGPGIPPEIFSQIFIPFFTTKNQGSGIGLSLSRQIMRLHKGRISVQSTEGEGTSFVLGF